MQSEFKLSTKLPYERQRRSMTVNRTRARVFQNREIAAARRTGNSPKVDRGAVAGGAVHAPHCQRNFDSEIRRSILRQ
jgi:hypothetical protein